MVTRRLISLNDTTGRLVRSLDDDCELHPALHIARGTAMLTTLTSSLFDVHIS